MRDRGEKMWKLWLRWRRTNLISTSTWTNLSDQGSNVTTIIEFRGGTAEGHLKSTKEGMNIGVKTAQV